MKVKLSAQIPVKSWFKVIAYQSRTGFVLLIYLTSNRKVVTYRNQWPCLRLIDFISAYKSPAILGWFHFFSLRAVEPFIKPYVRCHLFSRRRVWVIFRICIHLVQARQDRVRKDFAWNWVDNNSSQREKLKSKFLRAGRTCRRACRSSFRTHRIFDPGLFRNKRGSFQTVLNCRLPEI